MKKIYNWALAPVYRKSHVNIAASHASSLPCCVKKVRVMATNVNNTDVNIEETPTAVANVFLQEPRNTRNRNMNTAA